MWCEASQETEGFRAQRHAATFETNVWQDVTIGIGDVVGYEARLRYQLTQRVGVVVVDFVDCLARGCTAWRLEDLLRGIDSTGRDKLLCSVESYPKSKIVEYMLDVDTHFSFLLPSTQPVSILFFDDDRG